MSQSLKIILLNPPTAAPSSEILLNLAYLSSVLRAQGHTVKILDATAPYKKLSPEDVANEIKTFQPDFIGITLTISYIPQSYAYIKKLSTLNIPIVAGGPHPNALPEEVLKNNVAIVCIGEGEDTVIEIANYFSGQQSLDSIKGICYKNKNDKIVFTEKRPLIKNLDTIPFPDLSDFPIKNYLGNDDPNSNSLFWAVFSSRGCPFDCTFCSSHNVFGRTMRMRSAQNVFNEIKELHKRYQANAFAFQDDELLSSKKRFIEFCDLVAKSKLPISFSIRTRIDSVTPEVLHNAKAAGISRISFGIESLDDETLLKINKKYTVKTIQERMQYLSDHQPLPISFNNIIGFPWETKAHYKRIVSEIKKFPKNIKFFTSVVTPIPLPKTKLYDDYHTQYHFTDWWLDPSQHIAPFANKDMDRPFFMLFAYMFCSLYIEDYYWNYSKQKQADIDWVTWKILEIFLQKHFPKIGASLILSACKSSWIIWKRMPNLERLLFKPLVHSGWIKKLTTRLDFTKQLQNE